MDDLMDDLGLDGNTDDNERLTILDKNTASNGAMHSL